MGQCLTALLSQEVQKKWDEFVFVNSDLRFAECQAVFFLGRREKPFKYSVINRAITKIGWMINGSEVRERITLLSQKIFVRTAFQQKLACCPG